jgi:hypothetical protein
MRRNMRGRTRTCEQLRVSLIPAAAVCSSECLGERIDISEKIHHDSLFSLLALLFFSIWKAHMHMHAGRDAGR